MSNDVPEKKALSNSMGTAWLALALLVIFTASNPFASKPNPIGEAGDYDPDAPKLGKLYAEADILKMSVQGITLDMTQDQAQAVLKQNGWQGDWHPYISNSSEFPFTKDSESMYLFRYKAADGQLHIWSIVYNKRLAEPQDFLDWSHTVRKQYGDPTIKHTNVEYGSYVYYFSSQNSSDPQLEADISKRSITYQLSDALLSKQAAAQ